MLDVLVGLGKVRYLNHHSAEIFQPSVLNKTVAIKCQCALPIMMFVLFCPKREIIDRDLWNGWMVDGGGGGAAKVWYLNHD